MAAPRALRPDGIPNFEGFENRAVEGWGMLSEDCIVVIVILYDFNGCQDFFTAAFSPGAAPAGP